MRQSPGEAELALQLKLAKIPFEREFRFHPPRRWRFDFVLLPVDLLIAIEVEGGAFSGGHKRGLFADTDCEKSNAAMEDGYKVLRFTPGMVASGVALQTIERALGKINA